MTRPGARTNRGDQPRTGSGLIFRAWNLLLLLPLLMLITAWFNHDSPRLFGLPFFYWFQMAFVFVGVACVAIVYAMTRTDSVGKRPPATPVTPEEADPR